MEISKKRLIIFAAAAFLGLLCGFFVAKGMYDRPLDESVSRDTVTLHDTVPEYLPSPKDSARIKYVTRWLPAVHDTVYSENYAQSFVEIMHDTVAVQVPITSKHYGGKNYDAYVSGFEPSLDSIFGYFFNAGVDYGITSQFWQPFASGELTINNDKRLQLGLEGGMRKSEVTNNFEPFGEIKMKLKVF